MDNKTESKETHLHIRITADASELKAGIRLFGEFAMRLKELKDSVASIDIDASEDKMKQLIPLLDEVKTLAASVNLTPYFNGKPI